MTTHAERVALGIHFGPIGSRRVKPGEAFRFSVSEIHGSTALPVGITYDVISSDEINDHRDISAINKELGRREGTPNILHHRRVRREINQLPKIPSRIPGVWTELKWSPPTLAEKMTDALWDLIDKGKFGVELELFQVIQGVGAKTVVQLSQEFRKVLIKAGIIIYNTSPNITMNSYEVESKVGEEFLKLLTGVSPKGLLGGWKQDERDITIKDGEFRVVRTVKPNPNNDWDSNPTITYTLQRYLTAD